jgi:hypothetical protein
LFVVFSKYVACLLGRREKEREWEWGEGEEVEVEVEEEGEEVGRGRGSGEGEEGEGGRKWRRKRTQARFYLLFFQNTSPVCVR